VGWRAWGAQNWFIVPEPGRSEEHMADANPVQPGTQQAEHPEHVDGHRNAWILTGYGIFGLVVMSLIAYTVAQYAVR